MSKRSLFGHLCAPVRIITLELNETELQLSNSKPRIHGPAKSVAKMVGATSSEGFVAIAAVR